MTQAALDLPEEDINPEQAIAAAEAAMDAHTLDKWPQRLLDMIDVAEAVLVRAGDPHARERAESIVIEIARYCGGKQFYMPWGKRLHSLLRARRIYKDTGKMDVDALAAREGITPTQAYRDIAMVRAIERHRRQAPLFADEPVMLPTLGGRTQAVKR